MITLGILCFTVVLPLVLSQSNPSLANLTIISSPADPNVTISYKTPPVGICTTVFNNQKQYTGYVTLPPFTLAPIQQNYTINTFFWFIEARTNASSAPLTVYLNGGPGSSSMVGMFQEAGPCEVVEVAENLLGTKARDWGWDRSSNILFVDQPNQVGFSYDTLTNGSLNLLTSAISSPAVPVPLGQLADTFLNGTFSSGNTYSTANTSQIAAYSVWHMLQGFLSAFPQYSAGNITNGTFIPTGVNLFTESYGGKYGPIFASTFASQNQARKSGILPLSTLPINLVSLGIMQGCVDDLVQGRYYPIFAYNNTYGVQAYNLMQQSTVASSYTADDGCQARILACRNAVAAQDPNNLGAVNSVNQVCQGAMQTCNDNVIGPYLQSGRNVYDITQMTPDSFPAEWYLEYLNTASTQIGIGAPVNYTESNPIVAKAFQSTGDYDRGNQISDMAYLLSLGIRVALIYGDKDYICNWLGGEAISFSIAAQSPDLAPFYTAGYAEIVTNESYVGGVVRQYGNLSFSRIYDAGHLIPAYQPETMFTLFTRIILGTELSTGETVNLTTYTSNGTANATYMNDLPNQHASTCWIRDISGTCNEDQKSSIEAGSGTIINGVLYSASSDWIQPAPSDLIGVGQPNPSPTITQISGLPITQGSMPSSSSTATLPTGVFIATATPKNSASRSSNAEFQLLLTSIVLLLLEFI